MFSLHNLPFSQMQFAATLLSYSKYEEIFYSPAERNNQWSLTVPQTEEIPGNHGIEMTSIEGSFLLTSSQIEAAHNYIANIPLSSSFSLPMTITIEIETHPLHKFASIQQELLSSNQARESEAAFETDARYFDLISKSTNVVSPAGVNTMNRISEVSAVTTLSSSSPPPNNPIPIILRYQ